MRIVILGASGRIGRALLAGLSAIMPDAAITGCTRREDKAEELGLQLFDPAYSAWSALGHVDVLINAVGIIREQLEDDFERTHGGVSSLIVCNRDEIGSPKVIQISALGADETAQERFLQTKGVADRILLSAGNAVVVRPSVVCTDDTLFVQCLLFARARAHALLGVLPVPSGVIDTKIQPVCMVDLVELVARLCRTDDHAPVVNLTGPEIFSLRDFFAMMSTSAHPVRTFKLPRVLVEKSLSLAQFFFRNIPLSAQHLRLLQHDNTAPHTEARRLLGRDLRSTLPFWEYVLGIRTKRDTIKDTRRKPAVHV